MVTVKIMIMITNFVILRAVAAAAAAAADYTTDTAMNFSYVSDWGSRRCTRPPTPRTAQWWPQYIYTFWYVAEPNLKGYAVELTRSVLKETWICNKTWNETYSKRYVMERWGKLGESLTLLLPWSPVSYLLPPLTVPLQLSLFASSLFPLLFSLFSTPSLPPYPPRLSLSSCIYMI